MPQIQKCFQEALWGLDGLENASDCEFCPFSPLPFPGHRQALILGLGHSRRFPAPDSFQTIPYSAIVQPSPFLPSSFSSFLPCLLLSLPPFFPPILLPFPSISPFFPSHLPLFQKYLLCTYFVLNTLIAIQGQQKQTLGLLFWCGRQPVISLLFLRFNLNSDSLDLLSPDLEAPGNKGLVYFHSHFLQLPPSSSQQASH